MDIRRGHKEEISVGSEISTGPDLDTITNYATTMHANELEARHTFGCQYIIHYQEAASRLGMEMSEAPKNPVSRRSPLALARIY